MTVHLAELSLADVIVTEANLPKLLPVLVEDASPRTRTQADRIGMLLDAMVKGQPDGPMRGVANHRHQMGWSCW